MPFSLRAGDALHVAIAAEYGADLYTLDAHLAEAGPAFGVRIHLLQDQCPAANTGSTPDSASCALIIAISRSSPA
jgi:hypothetical protein